MNLSIVDPLEELKREYQESAAYHEAAHEVVCIAQKIPVRESGFRIDSKGNGVSHIYRRNAGDPKNTKDDVREREESIILLFAGYWGQVRIFPHMGYAAIAKDESQIDELLDEMYPHKSSDWYAAKNRLRDESERLVAENWPAIDALAKGLWSKPWKPQGQVPPVDAGWSDDTVEKSMGSREVEAILTPFGLSPTVMPESAGSYVRRATVAAAEEGSKKTSGPSVMAEKF